MMVCEDVVPDATNRNRLSLLRVVHAIKPKVGVEYPLTHPQLCAFAQLTEGRGTGQMRVEVRHADMDEVVYRSPTVEVKFPGNDPLTIHGVYFRFLKIQFPSPGLYWIQLWYDDSLLIQNPVVLRP